MDGAVFISGQIVNITSDSLSGPQTMRDFKILRRYPATDGPTLYSVRGLGGQGERMVPAAELSAAPAAPRRSKVVPLFPTVLRFGPRP